MTSVIEALSNLLHCHDFELEDELKEPKNRLKAEQFLKTKFLYTQHNNKFIRFKGLTSKLNATTAMAYNGYLNVTVQQHYYCKHRTKLEFPQLPLAVQCTNGSRSFYPLELLWFETFVF